MRFKMEAKNKIERAGMHIHVSIGTGTLYM